MTVQRGAREELAEALHDIALACDPPLGWHDQDQILTRFLPVVERMAAQRAADELRDAAAEESTYDFGIRVADRLRTRADALTSLDVEPAPTCQAPYTEGSYTWLCLRGTGHEPQHEDSAGHRW